MLERREKTGNVRGRLSEKRGFLSLGESLSALRDRADRVWIGIQSFSEREDDGIDGILVTVGLCIIALLLCVVMKDSLSDFIKTIVQSMKEEAGKILSGNGV